MKLDPSMFEQEDDDTWVSQEVIVYGRNSSVSLTVWSESGRPTKAVLERIGKCLSDLDALIIEAAGMVLDNYSSEHFRKLGVPEERLPAENVDSIAAAIKLESIHVFDAEADEFEMSFSAPWDDYHSFDVEFEDGKAVSCAVNG